MNPLLQELARIALVGIGATAVMDLWLALVRRLGVPTLQLRLHRPVGRAPASGPLDARRHREVPADPGRIGPGLARPLRRRDRVRRLDGPPSAVRPGCSRPLLLPALAVGMGHGGSTPPGHARPRWGRASPRRARRRP